MLIKTFQSIIGIIVCSKNGLIQHHQNSKSSFLIASLEGHGKEKKVIVIIIIIIILWLCVPNPSKRNNSVPTFFCCGSSAKAIVVFGTIRFRTRPFSGEKMSRFFGSREKSDVFFCRDFLGIHINKYKQMY